MLLTTARPASNPCQVTTTCPCKPCSKPQAEESAWVIRQAAENSSGGPVGRMVGALSVWLWDHQRFGLDRESRQAAWGRGGQWLFQQAGTWCRRVSLAEVSRSHGWLVSLHFDYFFVCPVPFSRSWKPNEPLKPFICRSTALCGILSSAGRNNGARGSSSCEC